MASSPARAGTTAVLAVLGAAALLLVLVTWAASIGPDRVVSGGHVEPVQPTPTATTTPIGDPPDPLDELRHRERDDPPAWVGGLALLLEMLCVVAALFLVSRAVHKLRRAWRVRRRERRGTPPEEVDFEVLGEADRVTDEIADDAAEQRALLEVPGEPRNAIVACWQRFEQQAERVGTERRPWQTTSEFVLGLLDLVGADPGAVTRLAELYREARFSDHPMTDEHRRAALEALDGIHRSLRPAVRR